MCLQIYRRYSYFKILRQAQHDEGKTNRHPKLVEGFLKAFHQHY